MKAMILAAGLGKRMHPLTLTTPKPLLKVGGKPLIVWHIERLKQAGITEIVINTAWLAEKLVEALGTGEAFGVKILWSHEKEGLETAGGILNALSLLGNEPFLLVNGDVWTDFNFENLIKIDLKEQLAHLILVENPEQHPQGDFLLYQHHAYCLDQISQGEALTYSGMAVLSPRLFDGLQQGKQPLAPLLKHAMHCHKVDASKTQAQWVDVGTPERLTKLDQALK